MVENSQELKLRDEIIGDAKVKAERLVARARNEAAKIVENAKKEAENKRKKRLEDATAEMDAKCRSILMGVSIKLRRHWLEAREKRLQAMLQDALVAAENASSQEHARSLEKLAAEAMTAMGPCQMQVFFPQKDAALVTVDWLRKIAAKTAAGDADKSDFILRPMDDAPAGLRFLSADGRKEYDNTYASRLAKMAVEIRIMLASEE